MSEVTRETAQDPASGASDGPPAPLLQIDDFSFTYRRASQPAVRGISLAVEAGEVLLVAGPSGCGKSTLIRGINGLIPHAYSGVLAGEVRIQGRPVRELRLRDLAEIVGTVLQDPARQIVGATVEAELAFGPENLAVPRETIREGIREVFERTGIGPPRGARDVGALRRRAPAGGRRRHPDDASAALCRGRAARQPRSRRGLPAPGHPAAHGRRGQRRGHRRAPCRGGARAAPRSRPLHGAGRGSLSSARWTASWRWPTPRSSSCPSRPSSTRSGGACGRRHRRRAVDRRAEPHPGPPASPRPTEPAARRVRRRPGRLRRLEILHGVTRAPGRDGDGRPAGPERLGQDDPLQGGHEAAAADGRAHRGRRRGHGRAARGGDGADVRLRLPEPEPDVLRADGQGGAALRPDQPRGGPGHLRRAHRGLPGARRPRRPRRTSSTDRR